MVVICVNGVCLLQYMHVCCVQFMRVLRYVWLQLNSKQTYEIHFHFLCSKRRYMWLCMLSVGVQLTSIGPPAISTRYASNSLYMFSWSMYQGKYLFWKMVIRDGCCRTEWIWMVRIWVLLHFIPLMSHTRWSKRLQTNKEARGISRTNF